jgi:hypothetical protein
MLQAGIRQKQIAKDVGIDQSVISRISTGARWYKDFVDESAIAAKPLDSVTKPLAFATVGG